jgi:hypothetical protein
MLLPPADEGLVVCPDDQVANITVTVQPRSGTLLAWSLWLVMFGCCATGLLATLGLIRPLTLAVLAEGAAYALIFPLAYGTIGLVLMLRRPDNPIGWLYAAAGLVWSSVIPLDPWVDQLIVLRVVPRIADVVVNAALLCLPVAIGLAVLRYRLWDLDRLVSRTVTYTLVTALLIVPYHPGPGKAAPQGSASAGGIGPNRSHQSSPSVGSALPGTEHALAGTIRCHACKDACA